MAAVLWAWYKFDGNANDSSGNGRNLTVTGTLDYVGCPVAPKGIAAYFDVINDYANVAAAPATAGADNFSISMWYRVKDGEPGTYQLVGFGNATNTRCFTFGSMNSAYIIMGFNGASDVHYTLTAAQKIDLGTGKWNHIGVVYKGVYTPTAPNGVMAFILNGKLYDSNGGGGGTANYFPMAAETSVMLEKKLGYKGDGYINDLRIYTGQLTAAEVFNLYAEGLQSHSLSFGSM